MCFFLGGSYCLSLVMMLTGVTYVDQVLEGQNILVTISGKKNRVRVYYLSWLKSKILKWVTLIVIATTTTTVTTFTYTTITVTTNTVTSCASQQSSPQPQDGECHRASRRLDQRGRPQLRRPLQDRQVREDQVPRHR